MTIRGKVRNGVIELEAGASPPDGTEVLVETLTDAVPPTRPMTFAEEFGEYIGFAKGLPPDFALNHDHYIHGLPKK